MANPNRSNRPDIEKSEQEVLNKSFDREFDVLATELLGHRPSDNSLQRLQVDEAGALVISDQQLAVVMKALLQAIAQPAAFDPSLNRTRQTAILESGTVTTVTTVTGMTNIDSYQGKLLMIGQDISAWANTVRERIT